MDSKSPNLNNYQQLCAKYKAFLLISSGHDFGVFGENGKGK
jgi:7-keto-8-aminopelargonate synthetase-like enzyme